MTKTKKAIINWPKIISENRDAIHKAIEKAYRGALSAGRSYTGFYETVQLDENGTVTTYIIGHGSMSMGVYRGRAITIASFAQVDITDDAENAEILQHIEGEGLREEFAEWLVQRGHIPEGDADDEKVLGYFAAELRQFNPDAWERLEQAIIEAEMQTFDAGEILHNAFMAAEDSYAIKKEWAWL